VSEVARFKFGGAAGKTSTVIANPSKIILKQALVEKLTPIRLDRSFQLERRKWLELGGIDLYSQREFSYQLVVGEATLEMLADHVNILEVALQKVALVNRRHAGSLINGLDYLDSEANRMCGGQT